MMNIAGTTMPLTMRPDTGLMAILSTPEAVLCLSQEQQTVSA